jgi:NAD(P)H-dependent FMN reductase
MQVTLLVGSVKGPKSTSDAVGSYLLERLEAKGVRTGRIYIPQLLASEQGIPGLLKAVAEADIIILAAQLFADSLSAPVVKAFELIHKDVTKRHDQKRRKMVAISNSGFPEAAQNTTSLAISRQFARACGFEWAGGLALGGGGAINGKRLEHAGGFVKNVKRSLDLTAEALAKGNAVPEEAISLMARPLMPAFWYLQIGANPLLVWLRMKRNGCAESVRSTPYRSDTA